MRPGLIIFLILFPLPVFIPALPIFGLLYLWASQSFPMEESAMIATVYTVPLYIVAIIFFVAWRKSRKRELAATPSPKASELNERQRRKHRKKAEGIGDILLTLELLENKKRRR